jgi:hypothetical protein
MPPWTVFSCACACFGARQIDEQQQRASGSEIFDRHGSRAIDDPYRLRRASELVQQPAVLKHADREE